MIYWKGEKPSIQLKSKLESIVLLASSSTCLSLVEFLFTIHHLEGKKWSFPVLSLSSPAYAFQNKSKRGRSTTKSKEDTIQSASSNSFSSSHSARSVNCWPQDRTPEKWSCPYNEVRSEETSQLHTRHAVRHAEKWTIPCVVIDVTVVSNFPSLTHSKSVELVQSRDGERTRSLSRGTVRRSGTDSHTSHLANIGSFLFSFIKMLQDEKKAQG